MRFIVSVLLCLVLVSPAIAGEEAAGSGEKTSSGVIYTGRCSITQLWVHTNGSNDAVVTLYDNTSAAGTKITPQLTCSAASTQCVGDWPTPRAVENGIYLSISGTGASAIVEYIPR